jgi:hypothetical protein
MYPSIYDCENVIVDIEDLPKDTTSIPRPKMQQHLIEIQSEETLHYNFKKELVSMFWVKIKQDKEPIGHKRTKVILPFAATYLCKAEFSALTVTKTKF